MNELKCIDDFSLEIKCVSHEIRNHLSICEMYSQIIEKNLNKEGIENDSINNAISCIQQSIKIINTNLLDLKSMNTSEKKIYDFKSEIEKAVELSKAYICENDIDFEIFIKNSGKIFIDENRFIACIVNVLKNAIEAIENKGKISVIGHIKNSTGYIKISNTGKVIKKDKQSKIFEKGVTSKGNGHGLGLWICKNYLQEQNATIELLKSTSKETTFQICIPVIED